ncbi:hypothetical protein HMPREF0083_03457 [Aneurinibacillus aneurinilyticus ATCC 12856]|uniref:Uncharacterized protein n=1 Tax=Aneurinibacillus aneurinilyticus ATCC 12856 TaxID=649747 RepID=U1YCD2_ANEAE|nr:hypothetical protein HMPREF0083_03457 [Aneurinibacillus aneurinilyticus ATCC 12856]
MTREIRYPQLERKTLISRAGGGTGPMKPGNHTAPPVEEDAESEQLLTSKALPGRDERC